MALNTSVTCLCKKTCAQLQVRIPSHSVNLDVNYRL